MMEPTTIAGALVGALANKVRESEGCRAAISNAPSADYVPRQIVL